MEIRISIIIPVYNKENYLDICIKSVQMQSEKNLEIICVDDGSTDNSLSILENLQKKDHRIIILQQENMGPGMARNKGLESAKGEFVHFLDADDYYMDEKSLENLYQAGIEQDVHAVGGLLYYDNGGKIMRSNIFRLFLGNDEIAKKVSYKDYQYDFYQYGFIFQREFLLKYNLRFPSERRIYEDPLFFVKTMTSAEDFYISPIPFYCYRWSRTGRIYSAEEIRDLLLGLRDNLIFSAENELKDLHRLTYYRINEWYLADIMRAIKIEHIEILNLLLELNASVNWEWIAEKELVKIDLIKPLALIMKRIETDVRVGDFASERYIFPFDKVKEGAKIALYGAGSVGNEYYNQLLSAGRYELALWLDRNADNIHNHSYKIRTMESLYSVQWDYIVIAIANMEIALAIWDELLGMGVAKEKIVWSIGYNDYLN